MKQSVQTQSSFLSSLTRVETNLINSFQLLQTSLNSTISQLHHKTSLMQDKFLEILHNKQKVILRLNNSIQSLKLNLGTVEETLVGLANSKMTDSYSVIEAHVNVKIEKFVRQQREKMGELETEVLEMEKRLEQKFGKEFEKRLSKNGIEAIRSRINTLEVKVEDTYKPISNYNSGDQVSSIRQELKQINKLVSKIVEDSNRHQRKIKQIQENSYRSTPHNTSERKPENKQDPFPANKYQTSDYTQRSKLNFDYSEKQSVPEVMEVGLRGLRKSKQKREMNQRAEGNLMLEKSKPLLLPPTNPPKKKDLPPLSKETPVKDKRKQIELPSKEEIEDELGGIFVDDQGYLIDEDGNYLRDSNGNLIDAQGLQQDEEQY